MKRCFCMFALFLFLFPALALAAFDLKEQPRLTKSWLVSALKGTEYENAVLYQPIDEENPRLDTSASPYYTDYTFFPVVAVQGDRASLVFLHRPYIFQNDVSWALYEASDIPLNHQGFTLTGFVIDADKDPDFPLYGRLDFRREDGVPGRYSLHFQVDTRGVKFYQATVLPPPDPAFLYADEMTFSLDGNASYHYNYSYDIADDAFFIQQYTVYLEESVSYGRWNCPDLNALPLCILDALTPRVVCATSWLFDGEILLRQSSSPYAPVLRTLSPGDLVLCQPGEPWGAWTLASVDGVIGYLPKENIAPRP